jgi:hypothetical protein
MRALSSLAHAQVSEVAQCRAKRDLLRTKRDLPVEPEETCSDKKRPACRAKRDLLRTKRDLPYHVRAALWGLRQHQLGPLTCCV